MKHILLTGEIGVGKSTVIRTVLARHPGIKTGGFRTVSRWDENEYRHVHMLPGNGGELLTENEIGICRHGRNAEGVTDRFDALGVPLLQNTDCDMILMDELGFMEKDALLFTQAVLNCLRAHKPVLGVIKPFGVRTTDMIRTIYGLDTVEIIEVNRQNRDAMPDLIEEKLGNILLL